MSFSSDVKEEMEKHVSGARHCQIAELAAIIQYSGEILEREDGGKVIWIQTENLMVARKYFTLLKKTFNIDTDIAEALVKVHTKVNTYESTLEDGTAVRKVLQAIKMYDENGHALTSRRVINPMIIKNACCRRAMLRGAYLTIGSMSDPEKSYHFELVCNSEEQAIQLRDIMIDFQVDAKIVIRKKYYVVYVKEGSGIVDLLNIMEAHVSLMNLENLRILKEMRNSINRRVNCEAANITKTVNAASKQIDDIRYIQKTAGFSSLQDNLREMAEIRIEYPDATLKELGERLNPPVGKSGVNHRLRKLSEYAERLRQ
ncbi:MAG: DNA-binding protein WhiA [Lachnospiraceae bacterium]|nr:DNA-binding protein WhiA [Lachnospiraceae bacterium]